MSSFRAAACLASALPEDPRLGPAYKDYRDPLTIGLIPLPLPFSLAVHLPWPCRLRYVVGEPVHAREAPAGSDAAGNEAELAGRVRVAMQGLLDQYGR
jgi:hypothetical protein